MNTNTLRRLNWLWKHRHTHDDDNVAEQLTIITGEIQQQVDAASSSGTGAYIHLERSAVQSIAVDGEAIAFDTLGLLGFAGFGPPPGIGDDGSAGGALTPSAEITIPLTAYWDVKLDAGWDTFTGGGSVWITRTRGGVESTIYPPAAMPAGIWTATDGQVGTWEAKGLPLQAGDIIKVYIDADDAAAQDLATAVVSVELVDRARNRSYYRALVLSHGPIAYWRLDETSGTTAADETGNGHAGTYTGSPTLDAAGVMTDGSGSPSVSMTAAQYVNGVDWADTRFTGLAPFSVEAWIHPTDTSGAKAIVTHSEGYSDSPPDHDGWSLDILAGSVSFSRYDRLNDDSVSGPVPVNESHHVVGTFDGTTMRLYVNGVLADSVASALTIAAHGVPLRIGIGDTNGTPVSALGYVGRVDEVAIWDRALSAAEVAEHWSVGSQGV